MLDVFKKLFGGKHERDVKAILPIAEQINEHVKQLEGISDEELRGKTEEFRGRVREGLKGVEEPLTVLNAQLGPDLEGAEREKVLEEIAELEGERDDLTREVLDELLPEAFAVVKEACRRLLGTSFDLMGNKTLWDMVPFDVQLVGGVVLHNGKIAEMATGEGKTLVATMPVYLTALPGRGVHLITVNDYLAKRDSVWMGLVY